MLSPRRSQSPQAAVLGPAWDSTSSDLSRFRATRKEVILRKLTSISKNNALGAAELKRKLGNVQGACWASA